MPEAIASATAQTTNKAVKPFEKIQKPPVSVVMQEAFILVRPPL